MTNPNGTRLRGQSTLRPMIRGGLLLITLATAGSCGNTPKDSPAHPVSDDDAADALALFKRNDKAQLQSFSTITLGPHGGSIVILFNVCQESATVVLNDGSDHSYSNALDDRYFEVYSTTKPAAQVKVSITSNYTLIENPKVITGTNRRFIGYDTGPACTKDRHVFTTPIGLLVTTQ